MNVQVYSLAYPVTSLGPGRRVVLWVAGCDKKCDGCVSPEMQAATAGRSISVSALRERMLKLDPAIDGITISGGEPFDQASALAELLEQIRDDRPKWNVLVYSGYTLAQIAEDRRRSALLPFVDVVIDGPFLRDMPAKHPLAGSGNQVIHFLSARGSTLQCALEACSSKLNWGLGTGSYDMLIGVADDSVREKVSDAVHNTASKESSDAPGGL